VIPRGVEVYVALDPIDLWGFDRLCGAVVERLGRQARSGALFVFFGRRRTGRRAQRARRVHRDRRDRGNLARAARVIAVESPAYVGVAATPTPTRSHAATRGPRDHGQSGQFPRTSLMTCAMLCNGDRSCATSTNEKQS
jgi:IS66 Orf2 like protein